jgi:hypothetical protein
MASKCKSNFLEQKIYQKVLHFNIKISTFGIGKKESPKWI